MQENDAKKNRAAKRYDEEKQQCELKDKQIANHNNDLAEQRLKKAGLVAQVAQSGWVYSIILVGVVSTRRPVLFVLSHTVMLLCPPPRALVHWYVFTYVCIMRAFRV